MTLSRVLGFAMCAAMIIGVAATSEASARQLGSITMLGSKVPKGFDHLLCYETYAGGSYPDFAVNLTDQFHASGFNTTAIGPVNACTPAKKELKSRKPLKGFTPNGHYVCYSLNYPPSEQDYTTTFENQLQENALEWVEPIALCVPTYKYLSGDASADAKGGPPPGFTHLMIYDSFDCVYINSVYYCGVTFANALPATTVKIYDQFFPNGFTTTLGNPFLLLTPTKKYYSNPRRVKPKPNGHWMIYYFEYPPLVDETRDYINQLEENTLTAYFPNWLMVPTYKYKPTGAVLRERPRRVPHSIILPPNR
jgi:hypothetical protein